MNICICGCKLEIPWKSFHKWKTPKYYPDHWDRSNPNKGKFLKKSKSVFTGYDRSRKTLTKRDKCSWDHIGRCEGVIDVCHVDQNPLNNQIESLIALCRSHHRLMDHGKIQFNNPIMPKFHVESCGKRRHKKLHQNTLSKGALP